MKPTQLKKLKQCLLQQLDEVTVEIGTHSEPAALGSSEVESSIVRSDDALVKKIELALRRIEDGSYGRCLGCGQDISPARLEAKPSVSLCTACQEEKERGE